MRTILLRDCSSSDSSFDTPIPCSVEKVIVDTPLKKDDVNLLVRLDGNEAQFEIEPITPCSLDFNSESQADVEDRDDNQNHIFTYPSGRLPLVPIDNRASSKSRPDVDKEAIEKKHKKCAKKEKESMSWISKTFCGLPSNSTLDNLGDITNDEIAMNCPFDDNVRFISDEGSVILVDDLDEGNANFYPYEDYAHTPQMKVGREKSIFRERTPQTPSNDTFDNLFQHALSCNTWQNWYDDEVCYKSKTQLLSTRCISKHPYNSSIDPKAKKKKMHHLRLNISPFGMAAFEETNQSPSKKYKPIKMRKKTISFPGKSHSQKKASANSKWTKNKSKKDYEWSSSIIATCGNFSHTQDIEIVPKFNCYDDESDGALCYDSDPGDQSFTSGPPMTRSLPIEHCRMNESQLEFDEDDLINEDICEDMVFELMTTRRLMVWHQETKHDSCEPPVAIHAWIETGTQLNSTLIQPKFCWQEAYTKKNNTKSVIQNALTFHAVDLLDISKIVPVDDIVSRDCYPLVKRKSSFLIEAFGGSQVMVFEARDENERQDIIDGLKLVVSRLGSKIIVGDCTVLNEFFSPYGSQVPGGIPSILPTH